jgi:hypothetical protein
MDQETANQLGTLLRTFNDKRVITQEEIQAVMQALIGILAENKKGVESLNTETKSQLEDVVKHIQTEHESVLLNVTKTLTGVEQKTKAQNDRAFKRLQELISKIKLPKDGRDGVDGAPGLNGLDGKDGSPDKPEEVRDKLEKLKGEERLDAKAIKNLPQYIKEKTKDIIVGGIRYLENLADVSIPIAKKREDLLVQYDATNKRWEDGVALTVSATQPTNPQINDVWIDIS